MSTRVARQLLLLGLASSVWSAVGQPSLLSLIAAYIAAWASFELPPIRASLRAAAPRTLALLAIALAAPGIAFGVRAREELAQTEGWFGAGERLGDRLRLEATPSIAPPLWAVDRPQTWFVSAPGATKLQLRAAGVRRLVADALGRGLFRIDYDPRRDGVPAEPTDRLAVELIADGNASVRELQLVRPLAHPRWFCVAPDRSRAVALSEETDELFLLDARGLSKRLTVGDGPVDCAFVDGEHVAVSYRYQRELGLWALASGTEARRLALPGRQGRVALSPSGSRLAVAIAASPPMIAVVRVPELTLELRVLLRQPADWLSFGASDDSLFATTRGTAELARFQRRDQAFVEDGTLAIGRPAITLARGADGAQLWAAATDVHAAGHAQLGNHFVQDQLLAIDTATLSIAQRRLTAQRSDRQSKPGDADRGISPMGLHEARDGGLWATFAGSDELWRYRGDDTTPEMIDVGGAGLFAPHGVAELADGTVLVSAPVAGAFGVIANGATAPHVLRVAPADERLLETDRPALARRVGERGFYEGTRSGIACQSCHLHADSDDTAYNLGDRQLLPTLTVRGLAGTAPYLRDGSYARLRDLDHVAETLYRGYLRNQAARDETIEAFVGFLPRRDPPQLATTRDRAAERRGVSAFYKARCDGCHTPPAFTNLAQLSIRALFPAFAAQLPHEESVDTPSLLSVAASPPYLNDGRAPTLDSVLTTHNRERRHGDVDRLSASERRDLVAFLSSL